MAEEAVIDDVEMGAGRRSPWRGGGAAWVNRLAASRYAAPLATEGRLWTAGCEGIADIDMCLWVNWSLCMPTRPWFPPEYCRAFDLGGGAKGCCRDPAARRSFKSSGLDWLLERLLSLLRKCVGPFGTSVNSVDPEPAFRLLFLSRMDVLSLDDFRCGVFAGVVSSAGGTRDAFEPLCGSSVMAEIEACPSVLMARPALPHASPGVSSPSRVLGLPFFPRCPSSDWKAKLPGSDSMLGVALGSEPPVYLLGVLFLVLVDSDDEPLSDWGRDVSGVVTVDDLGE
jgi:hypothetical protein